MKLIFRLKSPGMILFGSYAAMALGSLPVILLLCFADHLGVWWFTAFAVYDPFDDRILFDPAAAGNSQDPRSAGG